jgi:alkanesulfonate monooxygenase SsuD/methylene tetrahydromethanopterin reductase-like flavin-dependent oxidoreductase (luciferase family)
MRLGLVLDAPTAADAALAEELGFDLVWIDERSTRAPLVTVAALAPATSSLLFAAAVGAGPHPVILAEEATVADLACGGRLTLILEGEDSDLLGESADLLLAALAPRPFRHEGRRWRVPAGLPEHEQAEQRVRVMPAPAQLELTLWLGGTAAPAVAAARGLGFVSAGAGDDAAAHWAAAERLLGPASARPRRPALRSVDAGPEGELDVDALVAALRRERDEWGLDVLLARLPAGLDEPARRRAAGILAGAVRSRLALDRLPRGLEEHWRRDG